MHQLRKVMAALCRSCFQCSLGARSAVLALSMLVLMPMAASAARATEVYMVKVEAPSYMGYLKTMPATSNAPGATLSAQSYRSRAASLHRSILTAIAGSSGGLLYSYSHILNGFSASLTGNQAAALRARGDVAYVRRSAWYKPLALNSQGDVTHTSATSRKLLTTYTPHFLGLDKLGGIYSKTSGQGTIIGLIDSGVWPHGPSFNDSGMRAPPAKWKGSCQAGENFTSTTCNKKLIGARYYTKGFSADSGVALDVGNTYGIPISALDEVGHGSHTASTAAGAVSNQTVYFGVDYGQAHGVAYGAHIAVYKVCWGNYDLERFDWDGSCSDADILAAMEDAVRDGVDVISISLGAYGGRLLLDSIAEGSLFATLGGILTVVAGGNDGPADSTISNISPWCLTVAASTVARTFGYSSVVLGNNVTVQGWSKTGGTRPAGVLIPLIFGGRAAAPGVSSSDSASCQPDSLDPVKVKGKIVICNVTFSSGFFTSSTVLAAGAAGLIVATNFDDIGGEYFSLPSASVNNENGHVVISYALNSKSPSAYITQSRVMTGRAKAPQMADFSSVGPGAYPFIMKPDVTAPGVKILAAWSQFSNTSSIFTSSKTAWNIIDGTSMATPHVAGAALLLKSLHPDWTPGIIQSALITTAYTLDNKGRRLSITYSNSLATSLNYGAGHINISAAASPGLAYDQVWSDYLSYLCNFDYLAVQANSTDTTVPALCGGLSQSLSPNAYNYASFALPKLKRARAVTVTRRATLVGQPGTYRVTVQPPIGVGVTVRPTTMTFIRLRQTLEYNVTFNATADAVRASLLNGYLFGSLTWSDGIHKVVSPIQVLVLKS